MQSLHCSHTSILHGRFICNTALRAHAPAYWKAKRAFRSTSQSTPVQNVSDSWTAGDAGARKEWQRDDLHVVLVNPQIPQNTGSVARTCAATSVPLHLVRPLGYDLDSTKLKRAGLDYWDFVTCKVHENWDEFYAFFKQQPRGRLIAFSKFSDVSYTAPGTYQPGDWLLYGAETTGLPPQAHEAASAVVKIPMVETHVRSLNLAVSVGVGTFEAIRQLDQ